VSARMRVQSVVALRCVLFYKKALEIFGPLENWYQQQQQNNNNNNNNN